MCNQGQEEEELHLNSSLLDKISTAAVSCTSHGEDECQAKTTGEMTHWGLPFQLTPRWYPSPAFHLSTTNAPKHGQVEIGEDEKPWVSWCSIRRVMLTHHRRRGPAGRKSRAGDARGKQLKTRIGGRA